MHPDEKANWKTVMEALEAAGKTDNYYYRRAVAITKGGPDPLELPDHADHTSQPYTCLLNTSPIAL